VQTNFPDVARVVDPDQLFRTRIAEAGAGRRRSGGPTTGPPFSS
jgi:hypothetical protein